eukprot:gene12860-8741_t
MSDSVIQVSCHTDDFPAVESKLREWEEVDAVGSIREKKDNKADITTVIIKCNNSKDAALLKGKLSSIPELLQETKEKNKNGKKQKVNKGVDITAEVLAAIPSTNTINKRKVNQKKRFDNRNSQHGDQGDRDKGNLEQRNRGTGRGRGYRGRGRQNNFPRLPLFEASAAFVDNLPFGITNTRLMDIFSRFGRVLDINRYETMAMVCYDNPESVQMCIQSLNGSKVNENVVTVSSGTVRIPGEVVQLTKLLFFAFKYNIQLMLRSSFKRLDQTHGPHKAYKYTYMPDPRKLSPIETTQRTEVLPIAIRPPTAYVPNHEAFLEKADVHRLMPTSEFKSTFRDWNDLMTLLAFQNGNPPERFDTKEEWLYYKQFKTKDYSYRVIPELPEKYRPHQNVGYKGRRKIEELRKLIPTATKRTKLHSSKTIYIYLCHLQTVDSVVCQLKKQTFFLLILATIFFFSIWSP